MRIRLRFEVIQLCLLFFDAELLRGLSQLDMVINMFDKAEKENRNDAVREVITNGIQQGVVRYQRRPDVQRNADTAPGVQTERVQQKLPSQKQKRFENVFSAQMGKGVLEKYVIDNDDIDSPPDVVQTPRIEGVGVIGRFAHQPQQQIRKSDPCVKFKPPQVKQPLLPAVGTVHH